MDLRQKAFVYLLKRFIEIWKSDNLFSENYICLNFSNVKIMKLLYFFCLLDEGGISRSKNYFDKFEAYPLGPVNVNSYSFLKSEEGQRMYRLICKGKDNISDYLVHGNTNYQHILENILNKQERYIRKLIKMPVDELVEESHQSLSWQQAYYYPLAGDKGMDMYSFLEIDRKNLKEFLTIFQVA